MAEQVASIRNKRPVYMTKDGEKVPGVTTVLNLRNKPNLVEWAFKLGKENPHLNSTRDYVDDLANIGKCAHALIEVYLTGKPQDMGDFTPRTREAAAVPFSKFMDWTKGKTIKVIACERVVISDRHRYGGTLDVLADIDGVRTVLDFKTGKAIYPEMFLQLAAYAEAVKERGERVDAIRILQIGRVGDEGFSERAMTEWSNQFNAFLALRTLYEIEKCIGNNTTWRST